VTPFLGVAAHAVFIGATDLTYVHAHAAPATAPVAGGTGAAMKHDMTGMAGMDMPGMGGAPMRPGTRVSPDLTLHVRAPEAGTYLLWLQFMAGRSAPCRSWWRWHEARAVPRSGRAGRGTELHLP